MVIIGQVYNTDNVLLSSELAASSTVIVSPLAALGSFSPGAVGALIDVDVASPVPATFTWNNGVA